MSEYIIGLDEAGRGPLAGPVVASAVGWRQEILQAMAEEGNQYYYNSIRDSKKISPKKRERIFQWIRRSAYIGIGIVGPEIIDRTDILKASLIAMEEAFNRLIAILPVWIRRGPLLCKVDGDKEIDIPYICEAIVDGEDKIKEIGAASIVAKVSRDRIMDRYAKRYPEYGFSRHKGYGTPEHMKAIKALGITSIHRRSFSLNGVRLWRFRDNSSV